jgi:hypothetical protein
MSLLEFFNLFKKRRKKTSDAGFVSEITAIKIFVIHTAFPELERVKLGYNTVQL